MLLLAVAVIVVAELLLHAVTTAIACAFFPRDALSGSVVEVNVEILGHCCCAWRVADAAVLASAKCEHHHALKKEKKKFAKILKKGGFCILAY